jgi:hypothetical protein
MAEGKGNPSNLARLEREVQLSVAASRWANEERIRIMQVRADGDIERPIDDLENQAALDVVNARLRAAKMLLEAGRELNLIRTPPAAKPKAEVMQGEDERPADTSVPEPLLNRIGERLYQLIYWPFAWLLSFPAAFGISKNVYGFLSPIPLLRYAAELAAVAAFLIILIASLTGFQHYLEYRETEKDRKRTATSLRGDR